MGYPMFRHDCPEGRVVDNDEVQHYMAMGWVDSPDKLRRRPGVLTTSKTEIPVPEPIENKEEKIFEKGTLGQVLSDIELDNLLKIKDNDRHKRKGRRKG